MKEFLRAMGGAAAVVAILPALARYHVLKLLTGPLHACTSVSQRAARWSGDFGNAMRVALLRRILPVVGKGVVVSFGSVLTKPDSELGEHVYIGLGCILGSVRIGQDSAIADNVRIPSGARQHRTADLDLPIWRQKGEYRVIRIGCDTWIGSNATILADVGDHCIVGAGSVVAKPVPDYAIVVGNPARQVGDRREKADPAAQVSQGPPAQP